MFGVRIPKADIKINVVKIFANCHLVTWLFVLVTDGLELINNNKETFKYHLSFYSGTKLLPLCVNCITLSKIHNCLIQVVYYQYINNYCLTCL